VLQEKKEEREASLTIDILKEGGEAPAESTSFEGAPLKEEERRAISDRGKAVPDIMLVGKGEKRLYWVAVFKQTLRSARTCIREEKNFSWIKEGKLISACKSRAREKGRGQRKEAVRPLLPWSEQGTPQSIFLRGKGEGLSLPGKKRLKAD